MQDDLQRVPRFPWGDFPDVLRNGNLGELKQQPEYAAAKSGDAKAALSLADRVIRPEFVKAVVNLGASHPRPVLLPMLAEESVGDNRIPLAFAEVLSERLGWQVERDILQINRTWHTNAGADHRLIARCLFDGTVEHDAGYILIDDTLTMGGTLADLRGFIMNKGATLLGATVAVAHEGALHLPIRDKMQEDIYARHGKDAVREFAHEEFGYGIECLTQGEAGHIRKALSLDALRDRFTQARDALGQRVDAPGTTRPPHRRRADKREEPLTHRNLHPPPQALNRNDSFVVEAIPRGGHMAAQLDHLLSYGPMDVVASNDEKNPGLHIVHMDAENRAFIPQDDPLHREIRDLIEKNPHSKGFVANQIHARLEHEGRWDGPGHDAEGLSFGPSMNPEQEKSAPEKGVETELDPSIEMPNPRPFAARTPDVVPNGVTPTVQVQGVVVRDGMAYRPETVEPGEEIARWEASRTFQLPEKEGYHPSERRMTIESKSFDTQEEALAYARDLSQKPASREVLQEYQDKLYPNLSDLNIEKKAVADQAMEAGIKKGEQTREAPAADLPPKQKETAADIASDMRNMADQPVPVVPLFPEQQAEKGPEKESDKPKFERKNPPEVLFANPKGKPYVLDHGDKVTVTNRAMLGLGHEAAEKRRKAVEVGLKAAVDRFGEPVRFQGNRAFLEETVKVAMERGIALEPGSPMARDIYERAIKERGNQLGPSKDAAPYRAPEKEREVDKGKGIGL